MIDAAVVVLDELVVSVDNDPKSGNCNLAGSVANVPGFGDAVVPLCGFVGNRPKSGNCSLTGTEALGASSEVVLCVVG